MENYFIKVDGNQVAFASGQDDKNPLCVNYLAKGLLAIDNNVYVRNDENRFEYRGDVEQTAVFEDEPGWFVLAKELYFCNEEGKVCKVSPSAYWQRLTNMWYNEANLIIIGNSAYYLWWQEKALRRIFQKAELELIVVTDECEFWHLKGSGSVVKKFKEEDSAAQKYEYYGQGYLRLKDDLWLMGEHLWQVKDGNCFDFGYYERAADVHYDEHRDIISVEMGYFDTEQREDLRYTDYYIKNEFGFYVKKEW